MKFCDLFRGSKFASLPEFGKSKLITASPRQRAYGEWGVKHNLPGKTDGYLTINVIEHDEPITNYMKAYSGVVRHRALNLIKYTRINFKKLNETREITLAAFDKTESCSRPDRVQSPGKLADLLRDPSDPRVWKDPNAAFSIKAVPNHLSRMFAHDPSVHPPVYSTCNINENYSTLVEGRVFDYDHKRKAYIVGVSGFVGYWPSKYYYEPIRQKFGLKKKFLIKRVKVNTYGDVIYILEEFSGV